MTARRATCSVPECLGRVKGRGLCEKHWARVRRVGSTDLPLRGAHPCKECGEPTPLSNHHRMYCSRACKARSNNRDDYARRGEAVRASVRRYGASSQGIDRTLRRRYGISLADRERMREEQGGTCVFCDRTTLYVDHCHESGRVRGLLCMQHNGLLGHIGDGEPDRINAFLDYLGLERTRRVGMGGEE